MVKRHQSKSLRLTNSEFRKFVKAFRDYDTVELKKGYDKGYRIPNKVFIDKIMDEINKVLDTDLRTIHPQHLVKYLDKNSINDNINGTLLDNVVSIFTDAINVSDGWVADGENPIQSYLVSLYYFYLLNLTYIGAKLNRDVVVPKNVIQSSIPIFAKILELIESLEPNYNIESEVESDEESEEY
jgi:hypothetical protein